MADEEFEDQEVPPPPPPARGFDRLVRENPIAAIASAFVVGVLLGRLGIL